LRLGVFARVIFLNVRRGGHDAKKDPIPLATFLLCGIFSLFSRKDAEPQRKILSALASLRELFFFASAAVEEYLTS
jgi:hypothetical protein